MTLEHRAEVTKSTARCAILLAATTLTLACHGPTPALAPTDAPAALTVANAASASPSANVAPPVKPQPPVGTAFDTDLAFLSQHGELKILNAPSGGKIAVSSAYQARVMTSELEAGGQSLGFINRKFIEDGKTQTQFDNYGGEDRLWVGPEGGQYALYFAPQKPFTFDNWQTPHSLQEGAWQLTAETTTSLTYRHTLTLVNYAKREFNVEVERQISVLSPEQASERLGMPIPAGVRWVGFSTSNRLKNTGKDAWHESSGLLSVWILGMFAPVPGTRVIIPFDARAPGEIVNDRYFGKVPADRLLVQQQKGYLLFKCDGQYRSKIGLGPARAKNALGSYSEAAQLLTLIVYTKPSNATRYVNSMWETQKEPYAGDVINSYNDGPPAPGKPSLGGFYEIESSSPAAALAPGESLSHEHQTYHFSGPPAALEALAQHVLGVSLAELPPG
jgi:hypothetical protein